MTGGIIGGRWEKTCVCGRNKHPVGWPKAQVSTSAMEEYVVEFVLPEMNWTKRGKADQKFRLPTVRHECIRDKTIGGSIAEGYVSPDDELKVLHDDRTR